MARTARLAGSCSTRSPDISLVRGLRRFAALLIISTVLAQPLAAQDRNTVPELESLIPDSAVDNPEAWAKQGVPTQAPADQNAQPQPDTPLADMPLILAVGPSILVDENADVRCEVFHDVVDPAGRCQHCGRFTKRLVVD